MSRSVMYPEGSEQLNAIVPENVKRGIAVMAAKRRLSMSQIVAIVLEDWLRDHNALPEPAEREPAAV